MPPPPLQTQAEIKVQRFVCNSGARPPKNSWFVGGSAPLRFWIEENTPGQLLVSVLNKKIKKFKKF